MLKNLFGGKKQEFFVELDESQAAKVAAPAEAQETQPQPEVVAEADPGKVVAETQPEEVANPKKGKKTSIKKAAKKQGLEPQPVAVAPAATNGNVAKKQDPQEVEFATKYLMVPTGGRRRPGPSLNSFKNMARQVKTPRF
ncbi:conserved hypothetical protein [Rippkaea orientalis PCC 8801]|uniref:Uncharacterized protein n=1 Tax=Rippkaea orientalis (strain PCC 8801 / RF-1) TaxID=41431 RepID=B7K4A5_RIPO1|nr:hypothetical protein [Rippkaea orientalis]ACK67811.1 conserved hypothetical protein [Rippkaea orientalis PCC 8801]